MATKEELREAADKIKGVLLELRAGIRGASGFGKVKALYELVPDVVDEVEAVAEKLQIKGADKKALALDALFAAIRLPWWLPESVLRPILGALIDAAVAKLKQRL